MKRTVLVVDDEQNMQAVMRMVLEEAGYRVLTADSGESGLSLLRDGEIDVILTDLRMPGMGGEAFVERCRALAPGVPVIIVTAHGTIRSAVRSIRDGATDYLTKPFEPEEIEIAVHNALKLRDVLRENDRLRAAVGAHTSGKLLGASTAAARLLDEIKQVAPYRTNVLVTGESGTGKELVARAIHELSPRRDRAWVAINCSAIPRDLLESELFGYVRGAFTGAAQSRAGRLEQAQQGTLFLDEIGELDAALQAKLLRVLQEREYSPLGSDQVRALDVRVVAATNRDLKALVREGRFREDLYYRLDVYRIDVPPLRARREDIPLLAQAFISELAAETGKRVGGIGADALELLIRYAWPGNVRELRNAIERALLLCAGDAIAPADLPPSVTSVAPPAVDPSSWEERGRANLDEWLAEVERRAIVDALAHADGVQAQAARLLGVTERSLWHRIKKLGIQIGRRVVG